MKDRDYQKGKIYKLTSNQTDDIYIGSSCSPYLSTRFQNHKSKYNSWLNGTHNYMTSYEIIKYDDCKIELIELCKCECIEELTAREAQHIRTLNCVNKNIPGRTQKEYHQDNKEYLKEQAKEYREIHKEQKKEYQKEYQSKIIICDCGCKISQSNIAIHKKSQKHFKLLENII